MHKHTFCPTWNWLLHFYTLSLCTTKLCFLIKRQKFIFLIQKSLQTTAFPQKISISSILRQRSLNKKSLGSSFHVVTYFCISFCKDSEEWQPVPATGRWRAPALQEEIKLDLCLSFHYPMPALPIVFIRGGNIRNAINTKTVMQRNTKHRYVASLARSIIEQPNKYS